MATQQPTAAFGRELCGLHADVPHAGWGGKWASSTEVATGMVVKFNRVRRRGMANGSCCTR